MKPQRVLILHDYAGSRGGAEILALDIRAGFRARGIDTRLMTTTVDAQTMTPEETPEYLCSGTNGRLRALSETFNLDARRQLSKSLKEFQPDVVLVLMFLTALSPAILAPLRGTPTVYMHMTYREVCPTGLRWRPEEGLCTA
ncbi:MAG: glycosyltransferase, partial [Pseudomonadota bacterium]